LTALLALMPAPSAAGLADSVIVLPPVTIPGQRPLDGARQTTTTVRLDRTRLARFAPANVAEALVTVPGVDLVRTGPWASRLTLRGLGGDRVLLLVDGVRMNGVRGHGGLASLVPVDWIDAVEVQPGASGAQYGSDALGGVVQLSTHRGLFDGKANALLTLRSRGAAPDESWGTTARFRVAGPRAGFEMTGGAGGLDALVTPDGRVPHSGYRERNLSGRGAVQFGGTLLDYEHTWNAAYDVGLPAFGDALGSHGAYPIQSRHLDRLELAGQGAGAAPDARLLAWQQLGRSDFDETTVAPRYINNRLRGYNVVDAWDRVRNRALSLQPSLQWPRFGATRLAGDFRRETSFGPRATLTTTSSTSGVVTNVASGQGESMPHAERTAWAVAASAAPSWRRVRLELGTRYDRVDSRADSTAISSTPELAVTDSRGSVDGGLSFSNRWVEPYLHLATGFRVPNLEERYYHDEIHGGMVLFGNPRLESERSHSSELGLRTASLGPLMNARVSAYRSDVDELISIRYVDMLYGRPQFQYANIRSARIEGLEAQAQLKLRNVVLGLSGTLPRARDVSTGKKLTDPGTARAAFDVSVPVPRLVPNGQLAVRVRWNDAITGVDTTLARPAFSTTALEVSSIWAGLRASVAVRNLWNHPYREPLSFIAEPGRSVAFSLRRDLEIRLPFLDGKDR
jgi:outer membrane cobalamin receptor